MYISSFSTKTATHNQETFSSTIIAFLFSFILPPLPIPPISRQYFVQLFLFTWRNKLPIISSRGSKVT